MEPRTQLRDYVGKLLRSKGDANPFEDVDPLASAGRLDSLEIIQLVAFMEESFGVDFARDEFDRGNFESIATMLAFVDRAVNRA